MSITLDGSSGITAPTYGGTVASEYHVPVTAFKNRIINGAMQIDQRNAGASVATNGTNSVSLDRWKMGYSQNSKFTVQQNAGSVTPPSGFSYYLGVTSSSAYTVGSSEAFSIYQIIEGYNIADLGWGAVGASSVTLSFQVRSSLTGTFGGCLQNYAQTRSYPFSYTISSANTWTTISVTIPGDTTGTWLTTNSGGIIVQFGLGIGSTLSGAAGAWAGANYISATGATSVLGTNGATFYITGVQLEKGSTATSFDYRPYGTELALCQRYAVRYCGEGLYNSVASGYAFNTSTLSFIIPHLVQMRTQAAITVSGTYLISGNGSSSSIASTAFAIDTNVSNTKATFINTTVTVVQGLGYSVLANNSTSNSFLLSAEL